MKEKKPEVIGQELEMCFDRPVCLGVHYSLPGLYRPRTICYTIELKARRGIDFILQEWDRFKDFEGRV